MVYFITNTLFIERRFSKTTAGYIISGSAFIIGALIFCWLIAHKNLIVSVISSISHHSKLGSSQTASIWPGVYYTVSELRRIHPAQLLRGLNGVVLFVFSLLGALVIFIKAKRTQTGHFVVLMIWWTFFALFISFKGARFIAFLAIPLGIFFGAFIQSIYSWLKKNYGINFIRSIVCWAAFSLFVLWSSITIIHSGFKSAGKIFPFMNDGWHKALITLKEKTPEESVINTWWDYGSFIKAVAQRRVIFDGQSQRGSLAYWMAQSLITSSEHETLAILRMVNNTSGELVDDLNTFFDDQFQSAALLKTIVSVPPRTSTEYNAHKRYPWSASEKNHRRGIPARARPSLYVG